VPPKVRDLIARLERAGFVNRGGKGSHRNYVHPNVPKPITVAGKPGDDAKRYLVRAVEQAIEASKHERQ
jgi:predicted RNA binding protein YcfA (HicA-like mRNA interferase family)